MPTGSGKSILYQLPAALSSTTGFTLVVSPLISLMSDQILHLHQFGIDARLISSTTDKSEVKQTTSDMLNLKNSTLRLLYVTPEKIHHSKQFLGKLEKAAEMKRLSRIVIDEAHCCSAWGHDFRPDYKELGILRRQFPGVPILACTATATARVTKDVKRILQIPHAHEFRASFNRPNLHYSVRMKPGTGAGRGDCDEAVIQDMYDWLIAHKMIGSSASGGSSGGGSGGVDNKTQKSGIIYCIARKECESVAAALRAKGVHSIDYYHAERDPSERQRVHMQWSAGSIQIVVATNAFGLGINKPNVRFVFHCSIAKAMESYVQESGRCGRDGAADSWCVLWYRPVDMIAQSKRVFGKQHMEQNLYDLIRYCNTISVCRRVQMAQFFGERFEPKDCKGMCDVCELVAAHNTTGGGDSKASSLFEERDMTETARHIVKYLKSVESGGSGGGGSATAAAAGGKTQRVTFKQLVDAWKGRKKVVC